jgi:deoxyribodipyrimidine photolyase-related protein
MTVWLLGDQLHPESHVLDGADRVLLIEATDFADRRPYHPQKLGLVFAAMRHARDRLEAAGYDVDYRRSDTFGDALDAHFDAHPGDDLRLMRPPSHGAGRRLRELVEQCGGSLTLVDDDRFVCSPEAFDAWQGDGDTFRHEEFYRWMRRREGVLMDGGDPVGGEWNFDEANRETPPEDWSPPPVPRFEPDDLTRETLDWVEAAFDTWGEREGFAWPVTRDEALDALDHFVTHRLPEFGPYQDAMVGEEWALAHSLLSSSLNLGLLGPRETIAAAVDAWERDVAPIESVEGFVRQVLGWREFMRHVYRRTMPDLTQTDLLGRSRDLPPLYYDGETRMRCLDAAVGGVYDRGYAHHIERLMVLSNFATLYGADPHELNEWFHFHRRVHLEALRLLGQLRRPNERPLRRLPVRRGRDDRRRRLPVQRALLGLSGRTQGDAPGNGTDGPDVQPRRPEERRGVGGDPRASVAAPGAGGGRHAVGA